MSLSERKLQVSFLVFLLPLIAFGCAPAFRAHPDLEMRQKNLKAAGLIPPDVRIYELTAGGVREPRVDWSAQGKETVIGAIAQHLRGKPGEIKIITIDKEIQEEIEDIQALYRAVVASIHLHTYDQRFLFPEKQKNFDYSVGSLEGILQKFGADALIFVYGLDEISTGGRKALMVAGALLGVGIRSGVTAISVALVDSTGSVLWYNAKSIPGQYDLREPESAASLIESVLSDFPRIGK